MPEQITVLGSTGSIGVSTLDVIARNSDRFCVFALTANASVDELFYQVQTFKPRFAVLRDEDAAQQLQDKLRQQQIDTTEVLAGVSGLNSVAAHAEVDTVMAAIVGAAGLEPTLAAVEQGKKVLLANKESLVMAGRLFMDAVAQSGAQLLPIDSEHNAIFQCLPTASEARATDVGNLSGVRRILLTGSGGPFRDTPDNVLATVTPEQACRHPNWDMGRKISVDSATMMNKGLELIEACWLFNTTADTIDIVVHPQSIIHSMVEYIDGSVLAQLGNPDMRTPIAHALAWPERIDSGVSSLDIIAAAQLDFQQPDYQRFPCLRLATEVARAGAAAAVVLNAANEVAVDAFLQQRLPFVGIPKLIESVLAAMPAAEPATLDDVKQLDAQARSLSVEWLAKTA